MNSRIALGTAQFGLDYGIANKFGQVPIDQIIKMLRVAELNDVDTLDTAVAYGNSEDRLGQIGISHFSIITKLPEVPTNVNISEWVTSQIHKSLKRLKAHSVAGVLLHRPQQLLGPFGLEIESALKGIKDQGLAHKIGISIYEPDDVEGINIDFLDIVQSPYNLLDQRLFKSGLADKLLSFGIEIHTRSTFLQGLLLMSAKDRPIKFARWAKLWDQWQEWLNAEDISAIEACLRFVLKNKTISKVVVGATCEQELTDLFFLSQNKSSINWPDFISDDPLLLNPFNWPKL